MDISPALLDPDAPVHPPAGMTVEQCLAVRARLAENARLEELAEEAAQLAGLTPNPHQLAAEDRDRFRIAAAEDRREGRTTT
jgi:hypothetical protein